MICEADSLEIQFVTVTMIGSDSARHTDSISIVIALCVSITAFSSAIVVTDTVSVTQFVSLLQPLCLSTAIMLLKSQRVARKFMDQAQVLCRKQQRSWIFLKANTRSIELSKMVVTSL